MVSTWWVTWRLVGKNRYGAASYYAGVASLSGGQLPQLSSYCQASTPGCRSSRHYHQQSRHIVITSRVVTDVIAWWQVIVRLSLLHYRHHWQSRLGHITPGCIVGVASCRHHWYYEAFVGITNRSHCIRYLSLVMVSHATAVIIRRSVLWPSG